MSGIRPCPLAAFKIGLSSVFPKVTQLDFTGPLQVFTGLPGAEILLIWQNASSRAERLGADADANRHLCGLSAA